MSTVSYPKKGQSGTRQNHQTVKGESEQFLKFGEPAQLPKGIGAGRVFTNNYKGEPVEVDAGSDHGSLGGPGLDGNLY